MAIFHCSVKTGSRSGGKSAVASAAYRAGDKLKDNETGIISDYTHKGGVVFSEISLCNNAPSEYMNREVLWNAVHSIEKQKNARLYREFEVALPVELSRENQIDTVREFVSGLTNRGMCADWALHDKGDGNPHAHIMTTTRSIKEDGSWAPKSRKIYDLDENGEKIFQKIDKSGRKQYKSHKEDYNDWNETERIEEWRTEWEQCCNKRLDKENQIDHRSFERQGIECIPTIHEGYTARKIVADGGVSERIEHNKVVKKENILLNLMSRLFNAGEKLIKSLINSRNNEMEGTDVKNGKQRIAELLSRRNKKLDNFIRNSASGERRTGESDTGTISSDTAAVIRQSQLNRRGAIAQLGYGETQDGNTQSSDRETENCIRQTELAVSQSVAVIDESKTTVASAAFNRRKRDDEEQRRKAAEIERIRREEQEEMERSRTENEGRSFSR